MGTEQDLQLTSASPHVSGTIDQGNAIKHEIHISISTYHAIPRQTLSYTMPCPLGHTVYHDIPLQAIPYTMPCPPWDIITLTLGNTICHARQATSYSMSNLAMSCPQGLTIYRAIPRQVIRYTMSCPTGHTMPYPPDNNIYHAIPRQANTHTMRCPPGHTTDYAMPARPYHIMPCLLEHTIYHAMPAKPYPIHVIPPGHTKRVYHPISRQAIPYIPCHVR